MLWLRHVDVRLGTCLTFDTAPVPSYNQFYDRFMIINIIYGSNDTVLLGLFMV